MTEYIDKITALDAIERKRREYENAFLQDTHSNIKDSNNCGRLFGVTDAQRLVYDIPAADVTPVIHAKWIIDDFEELIHTTKVWKCHCSNCNKDPLSFVYGSENWWTYKHKLPPVCPYCSAKMDKE